RTGLRSDEIHSEHFLGDLLGFIGSLRQFHAATLAAAAGMNLRLDHDGSTDLFSGGSRLFLAVSNLAARNPNAVARKDLLGLILVYFHVYLVRLDKRFQCKPTTLYREHGFAEDV